MFSATAFVPVICILMIMIPAFAGIVLLLPVSKNGHGHIRFAISAILVMGCAMGSIAILMWRRFGIAGMAAFIQNISGRNFLYQDVRYLCLVASLAIIVSIVSALVVRRLFRTDGDHISFTQEYVLVGSVIASGLIFAFSYYYSDQALSHIVIRDLHVDGSQIEFADDAVTTDHVIIENTFDIPVDLEEMYLSDRPDKKDKLSLKGIVLLPQEERAVMFDDASPFRMNDSETLYLSDSDGHVYKQLSCAEEETEYTDGPLFSKDSGFYEDEFDLTISMPEGADDDVKIFYTVDGNKPTTSSTLYTGPIHVYDRVDEGCPLNSLKNVVRDYDDYEPEERHDTRPFVVRAAAFDDKGRQSRTVVGTYFFGDTRYNHEKVISLTADYDDLFGDRGICVTGPEYDKWYQGDREGDEPDVNFLQSGREWEIEGNLQYFDNGKHIGGQDVGLRVFGGYSRNLPNKRFSIYSRKSYSGSDFFLVDFFDRSVPLHSVCLRGIGNTDAIFHDLAEGLDVTTQAHTHISVFLNGEKWCGTYLCEKYSPAYFFEHYGIPENDLIVIKEGLVDCGKEEDFELFNEIFTFVTENDMADPDNYAKICDMIDVQSYIDYMIVNMYICNFDQDEFKNRMLFRVRTPIGDGVKDGRWRWMLYDMDAVEAFAFEPSVFDADDLAAINPFTAVPTTVPTAIKDQILFKELRKNEEFCKRFVDSYLRIMETNFSVENASVVLERYGSDLTMFDSFFEKRGEYMKQFVLEEFGAK